MDVFKMRGLLSTVKIRQYCDYIDEHLVNVSLAWDELSKACKNEHFVYDDYLWFSIDSMIRGHDLSKMSMEEFIPYQMKFFPVGEPDNSLFDDAWKHHQDHNPHHWQNWTKIERPEHGELVCHCVCMVVDWMAMSRKFGGTAEQYYKDHKDEIEIPDWAKNLIENIFFRLRTYREAQNAEDKVP